MVLVLWKVSGELDGYSRWQWPFETDKQSKSKIKTKVPILEAFYTHPVDQVWLELDMGYFKQVKTNMTCLMYISHHIGLTTDASHVCLSVVMTHRFVPLLGRY